MSLLKLIVKCGNCFLPVPFIGHGRHRHLSSHRLHCFLFGMQSVREPRSVFYSTIEGDIHTEDKPAGTGKLSLAESLACLVDESARSKEERKALSRNDLKRLYELRIKRRVKEQFVNGKFRELMSKVVAIPNTLQDAYNSLRVDSNVDISSQIHDISFELLAEELANGTFDIKANTFSVSTKGDQKEVLVLPKLKLKVVQEAIRIVLEVVYRPHFLKISHGGRSGRGHSSAIKYICKEVKNPDWWFTVILSKKLDAQVLDRLVSTMVDKIDDPLLYATIRSFFDAQVLNLEFGGFPKAHGLPQEGVLSTILMNVYLNVLDHEFYRLSMRYEALISGSDADENGNGSHSKLRSWFRRSLKDQNVNKMEEEKSAPRVYCCRFMDEIFLAVSGPEEVALALKSDVQDFLKNTLHLDLGQDIDVLPCDSSHGIRFLGKLLKRTVQETPALRAVHKLKEKVGSFASQKQEIWDAGTARIGKKWLAHGLKKVKESEIQHLADNNSLLTKISCYRKSGMETDHWYKQLVKIWMHDVNAKASTDVESILSRYIVEPSLPQELKESFYEFQKRAEEYVCSETESLLALVPGSISSEERNLVIEAIAPVNVIKKRLFRYKLTNTEGYSRASPLLVLLDSNVIIDWYSGLVRRWLKWYSQCSNFNDLKLILSNEVRKSCIRTLATKYRIHENEIERRFDAELVGIPSTLEIEDETLGFCGLDDDVSLGHGSLYSGLCVLSLTRLVSQSRPCDCFVVGCSVAASCVYTLHVMERQKFPGWKTGFISCIHPSLNRRRIGLCQQHLKDLFLGHISLQCIDFGSWK
ncbi:hypothetical protein V2J09_007539 [Rumex salicifolius]